MTLLQLRRKAIAKIIEVEVEAYLLGRDTRGCATDGKRFKPKHRWHFFCCESCRKVFYRGQFKPRD